MFLWQGWNNQSWGGLTYVYCAPSAANEINRRGALWPSQPCVPSPYIILSSLPHGLMKKSCENTELHGIIWIMHPTYSNSRISLFFFQNHLLRAVFPEMQTHTRAFKLGAQGMSQIWRRGGGRWSQCATLQQQAPHSAFLPINCSTSILKLAKVFSPTFIRSFFQTLAFGWLESGL